MRSRWSGQTKESKRRFPCSLAGFTGATSQPARSLTSTRRSAEKGRRATKCSVRRTVLSFGPRPRLRIVSKTIPLQHESCARTDFQEPQQKTIAFCDQQETTEKRRRTPYLICFQRHVEFTLSGRLKVDHPVGT